MQVLGGSLQRWETRAETSGEFLVDLQPYDFDMLRLFSTSPWPGVESKIELDLSMTNQVEYDEAYEVRVKLPEDFIVDSKAVKCTDTMAEEEGLSDLPCEIGEDG